MSAEARRTGTSRASTKWESLHSNALLSRLVLLPCSLPPLGRYQVPVVGSDCRKRRQLAEWQALPKEPPPVHGGRRPDARRLSLSWPLAQKLKLPTCLYFAVAVCRCASHRIPHPASSCREVLAPRRRTGSRELNPLQLSGFASDLVG